MRYLPVCGHPRATSYLTTDENGRMTYHYTCPDCGYKWTVTV